VRTTIWKLLGDRELNHRVLRRLPVAILLAGALRLLEWCVQEHMDGLVTPDRMQDNQRTVALAYAAWHSAAHALSICGFATFMLVLVWPLRTCPKWARVLVMTLIAAIVVGNVAACSYVVWGLLHLHE